MIKRVLSIIVAMAILCTMAIFAFAESTTVLNVVVDKADLRPGDKVTATVQLNNYADNWSAMSVDVTYDVDHFDLDGSLEDAVSYEGFIANAENGMAEIFQVEPGLLRFVWMATSNISVEGDSAISLITLNLIAKEGAMANSLVQAQLAEDGQLSIGKDDSIEEIKPGNGTFSAAPVVSEDLRVGGIVWEEQPILKMELKKDRIQVDSTGTAIIYIEKYMPWSQLSVDFGILDGCLRIDAVEPLGFKGDVNISGNNVTITAQSNQTGEGYLDVNGTLEAMKVTFSGVALHETFDLTASFAEGKQKTVTETLAGDVHYKKAGDAKPVTVVPKKTDLEVTIDAPENLKAGQEFDVYVNLKEHENEWAAFTLFGTFDRDLFEVVNIETFNHGYSVVEPESLTDELEFVWFSTENVKIEGNNPTVLKIRFKAIQATTAGSISFAFKQDGVVAEGDEGFSNLTGGEHFTNEDKDVSVDVDPTPMKLTYKLTDMAGNDISEIKAGKQFKVTVTVNDYYEKLAALSVKGTFDTTELELISAESLIDFGESGAVVLPDVKKVNGGEDELEVVWISAENVALPSEFEAVTFTFMAKETDNASIEFGFIEGGILHMDPSGMPEALDKDTYFEDEPVNAEVDVTPSKVMLKTIIEKETDQPLMAGDEFTAKVYFVDYFSPMAAISIEGVLDPEIFEIIDYTAETLGDIEPILPDNDELEFVWVSPENIVTGQQEFLALTVRVRAKRSSVDEAVSFGFIEGGMVRVDSTGLVDGLEAGVHFADPEDPEDNKLAIAVVPVAKKPVEMSIDSDNAGTVEAGDEFNVTLSLSEFYEGDWSSFGIYATFDTAKFAVVGAESKPLGDETVFAWTDQNENGKNLVLGWVGLENIEAIPDELVTITFKALETAKIDDALEIINFNFAPDVIYTCNGDMDYASIPSDGSAYSLDPVVYTINIIHSEESVEVILSWGSMAFTYNYGKWNTYTHEWDNAGWICEKGADKISVQNVGNVGVQVDFAFAANDDVVGITGQFDRNSVKVEPPEQGQESKETVTFALIGKTEEEWETEKSIGLITVAIRADGVEEEVAQ